jgi:hypothetical protein
MTNKGLEKAGYSEENIVRIELGNLNYIDELQIAKSRGDLELQRLVKLRKMIDKEVLK